jgi:hypothetical protein
MRRHLTYANVIATLALFFALAGGSYAATQLVAKDSVGPAQLRKSAVTGRAIKDNAVKGADVDESSLAKVPSAKAADRATTAATADSAASATTAQHAATADTATSATSAANATNATNAANATTAANAATLDGLDSTAFKLRCPTGTRTAWGACLELDAHAPATPLDALADCSARGGRLPTWLELSWVRRQSDITWAAGAGANQYELTGEAADPAAGTQSVIAIDRSGNDDPAIADSTVFRYRCVLAKING